MTRILMPLGQMHEYPDGTVAFDRRLPREYPYQPKLHVFRQSDAPRHGAARRWWEQRWTWYCRHPHADWITAGDTLGYDHCSWAEAMQAARDHARWAHEVTL